MSLASYFRSVDTERPGLLSRFSDLLLTGALVAIIGLMIVPLPAWAIDGLVAVNIACGAVLLLLAVYIKAPLEFSVFPSVLLITTLFRLALSIATTRMILLHGDAGHIIDTFGKLVAGGNLVVGLVVFLIITVVQFIVIAKGAERVAEVAARFSLDAMPGKQMSIDSDLRSGLIDKDEARRRRRELEQESKLHGSLDGAMKFVKGDAIAGIVIIVINLLGGLAVGVLQQDMAVGAAMVKYSILTIGDGMVAQIPALLGAMAAGLIVTRATDGDRDQHLGDAIARQIAAKPRVLLVGAGLCLLLSMVPGFPSLVFLLLAAVMGIAGVVLTPALSKALGKRLQPRWQALRPPTKAQDLEPKVLHTQVVVQRPNVPLLLELPTGTVRPPHDVALIQALEQVLDHFHLQLGLTLPRIDVHHTGGELTLGSGEALPPEGWRLMAYEVPIAMGDLPEDDLAGELGEAVRSSLRRHVGLFLGMQEANHLLTRASADYPDLVRETLRALPIARVAEILRRMVEEEVPIRNLRDILETLSDAAQREKDVHTLTELVRIALKRQITYRVAPQGHLRAVLLQPDLEDLIRGALRISGGQQQLALDARQAHALMARFKEAITSRRPGAVVVAIDIRRQVRKLIEADCFDTPVLSFHELLPNLNLEVVERVSMDSGSLLEAA